MLERLSREVDRYERVVTYWPVFGPQLEGTSCAALRDTTGAVSRQCGLTQVSREEAALGHPPGAYLRGPSGGYGAGCDSQLATQRILRCHETQDMQCALNIHGVCAPVGSQHAVSLLAGRY